MMMMVENKKNVENDIQTKFFFAFNYLYFSKVKFLSESKTGLS